MDKFNDEMDLDQDDVEATKEFRPPTDQELAASSEEGPDDLDPEGEELSEEDPVLPGQEESLDPAEDEEAQFEEASRLRTEEAHKKSSIQFQELAEVEAESEKINGKQGKEAQEETAAREEDGDPEEEEEEKSGNFLTDWLIPIIIAFAIAFCVRQFVGGTTTVRGNSMDPTLQNGDVLIVSKIPTYNYDFKRADIAIIDAPDQEERELYVKRIIGLPGEKIRLVNGNILINGMKLKENYTEDIPTLPNSESEWTLGNDEYFVLGDNRQPGASNDSRYFGPINKNLIEGVATFRLFPISTARSF